MRIGTILSFLAADALIAFLIGKNAKSQAEEKKEQLRKLDEEMPEPTAVWATATNKLCGVGDYSRVLFPKSVSEYAILFLTDTGEDIALGMTEEEYLSIGEGERGLLVYMNQKFMAFDKNPDAAE